MLYKKFGRNLALTSWNLELDLKVGQAHCTIFTPALMDAISAFIL